MENTELKQCKKPEAGNEKWEYNLKKPNSKLQCKRPEAGN